MKSKTKKSTTPLTSLPGLKYLNEVDTELKKVTWPDRQQVIRMSTIVIAVSIFIGVYLGLLDSAFTFLFKYVINTFN